MKLWKICGITNIKDAEIAAKSRASVIGCVFHPQSKRYCKIDTAKEIIAQYKHIPLAAVFAYNEFDYVVSTIHSLYESKTNEATILIQIPYDHDFFSEIEKMYMSRIMTPVIPVREDFQWEKIRSRLDLSTKQYAYLIFDTGGILDQHGNKMAGGTGVSFDWETISNVDYPFLLAGGINENNIDRALSSIDNRYGLGIDISGGLEASPGLKDPQKIEKLQKYFQFKEINFV